MNEDVAVSEQIEIAVELDRRLSAGRFRTRRSAQHLEVVTDIGAGIGPGRP
jgi:hypothetical protein